MEGQRVGGRMDGRQAGGWTEGGWAVGSEREPRSALLAKVRSTGWESGPRLRKAAPWAPRVRGAANVCSVFFKSLSWSPVESGTGAGTALRGPPLRPAAGGAPGAQHGGAPVARPAALAATVPPAAVPHPAGWRCWAQPAWGARGLGGLHAGRSAWPWLHMCPSAVQALGSPAASPGTRAQLSRGTLGMQAWPLPWAPAPVRVRAPLRILPPSLVSLERAVRGPQGGKRKGDLAESRVAVSGRVPAQFLPRRPVPGGTGPGRGRAQHRRPSGAWGRLAPLPPTWWGDGGVFSHGGSRHSSPLPGCT